MKPKKILFISHMSTNSGASSLLLYLMQWLKANVIGLEIDFYTLKRGALDEEIKKTTTRFYAFSREYTLLHWFSDFVKKRIFKDYNYIAEKKQDLINELATQNYDIIYANTCLTIEDALQIKKRSQNKPKVICNIHELKTVIDITVPNFSELAKSVDHFIGGSNLVNQTLINNYGIDKTKISLIYDFTSAQKPQDIYTKEIFTVGGMGGVEFRKGTDIFLQLCRYITYKHPELDIKFVWVGAMDEKTEILYKNDIEKLQINNKITLYNERSDYKDFYSLFSVFVLPSREDPFPLVAIEAGISGLPIISFEYATGINEIIAEGGGFIVPYLDIEKMAEKIIYYYHNRELLEKDGAYNKKRFDQFTVEKAGPEILGLFKNLVQ